MSCYKLTNLRFSDLYRNVARYLKYHECGHDFTGTRLWLARWTDEQGKAEEAISRIRDAGASCDSEVLSIIKPKLNGGTLLIEIREK